MGDQFNHNFVNHQLLKTIGLISEVLAIKDWVAAFIFF